MLDPDNPLIEPPDPELLSLRQPGTGDPLEDLVVGAIDYYNLTSVVLPAFDERGFKLFPPDEHVLDDLCRRYDLVDNEEMEARPPAGTVAVVIELANCDNCRAVAEYEAYHDGLVSPVCSPCLRRRGDGLVGPGHAVHMMHSAEVPYAVREVADELCRRRDRPALWDPVEPDLPPWMRALSSAGFVGPYDDGSMRAWFFGTLVVAAPHPTGFRFDAYRNDGVMTLPGEGVILPADLDPLQIREAILAEVGSTVGRSLRNRLRSVLQPSVRVATDRALRTMDDGTYQRHVNWDDLILRRGGNHIPGGMRNCERTAAEVAARGATDGSVVARIATEHPDGQIRALAVANAHCPDDALLMAAETDNDGQVRNALLERDSPPVGLVEAVTMSVLLHGSLDLHLAVKLLLREDCPPQFEAALLDRVYAAGPQFRVGATRRAHAAPPERRDLIHTHVLRAAKRIPYTVELIDAILGDAGLANDERIRWLLNHPDRRIARLATHYLTTTLPREGTLADALAGRPAHVQ